jgi:hypothetical protein
MNRRFANCLVLAVALCLVTGALAFGHETSNPVATASGQKTYAKFTSLRVYKPSTFYFGAHEVITGVSWSKWGKKIARGHGTYQVNSCIPDCADGTFTPTPASIILTGRERCGPHFVFRHMKVYFAGHRRQIGAFCK